MVEGRQCRPTFSILPPSSFSILPSPSFLMQFSQTLNSILAGTLKNLSEVILHAVTLATPFTEV